MSYFEELMPAFRKGAKIRRRSWPENRFISQDGAEDGHAYGVSRDSLNAEDWEYVKEPVDWDYVIKNQCNCRFSNKMEDLDDGRIGTLRKFFTSGNPFLDKDFTSWKYCRPLRRDEFVFYEDKDKDVELKDGTTVELSENENVEIDPSKIDTEFKEIAEKLITCYDDGDEIVLHFPAKYMRENLSKLQIETILKKAISFAHTELVKELGKFYYKLTKDKKEA